MPDEHGNETREEALERIRIVRATQIFGDTPTDPTIGDVVVPAHDEEAATVATAEVDARADEGDAEAADLAPGEAKRQNEALSAADVEEAVASDEASAEGDRKAAEVISDIESASTVEEVDSLAEGDDRVTVQRAADKKRDELSE